ncbi:MAG: amino acid ABC transporter permease, partial [Pseudomonadota bacterium]
MRDSKENTASGKVHFWLDSKKRAFFFQVITFCLVGLLAYYLISNILNNLEKQKIATGFGFLKKES